MPQNRWRVPPVLALILLLTGGPPRAAQAASDYDRYLTAAVRLYEGLEYEQALAQLKRARRSVDNAQQDVTVSLYEGLIFSDMGRWARVRAAFKTALLLDPEAKLPVKASPKVVRELEKMRVRVRKELARQQKSGGANKTVARTEPPPPAPVVPEPVAAAPVAPTPVAAAPADRPEQPPEPRQPLLMPPPPSPAAVALTPTVEEKARGGVPTVSWVLAGVGVAAAGGGAYFGLNARGQLSAAQAANYQDETYTKLEDARGNARIANILFGTAGLAATSALLTYLFMPGDAPAASAGESR